jgi:hypothetical protein
MVVYEWVIEKLDVAFGQEITEDTDVIDVRHADTYAEALDRAWTLFNASIAEAIKNHCTPLDVRVGLVRDHHADGYLDRTWAYLDDEGNLPEYFSDLDGPGKKVPARFHAEIKKHHAK